MRVAVKVLIGLAGLYAVLVVGSGLAIKAMLTPGRIGGVVNRLTAGLPVRVSAGEGSFDLAEWIRFQPLVRIRKIMVSNPPGFGAEPLLAVEEAGAQLSLLSLFGREVRVRLVELRQAAVNIESDAKGRSNVAALVAALEKGGSVSKDAPPPEQASGKQVLIERVAITDGSVRYRRAGQAADLTLKNIQITVSGFGGGSPAQVELAAGLFGSRNSALSFKGQVGPAAAEKLPAEGELGAKLAPAEMPLEIRKQYLGEMLGDPPAGALLALAANVKGDLMSSLDGTGHLQFENFALGRSKETRLPLAGKAPFQIAVRRPLADPAVSIAARSASLKLGQGEWKGSLVVQYRAPGVHGESSGSVRGVRIEELLRAFTATKETVSGVAEIPEYSLEFAGRDATELRDSLKGAGVVRVEQGRVALFDLLGTIEAKVRNVLSGESAKAGATDFLTLEGRFEIRDGRLLVPELMLRNSASAVTGQGFVTYGHEVSFDLMTDMKGELASRLGGKRDAAGEAHLLVPVRVRGALESPKVYPDVGSMVKGAAVEKARGLLDSFLKRRQGQPEETDK